MSNKFKTIIRLNLENPEECTALEYFRKYRPYSIAIVEAVNGYYSRLESLEEDPYLETREKEDEFLNRIEEAVRCGQQATANINLAELAALLQGVQPAAAPPEPAEVEDEMSKEDYEIAMDFMRDLCGE